MESIIFKHNKRPIIRIVLLLVLLVFLALFFFFVLNRSDSAEPAEPLGVWDYLKAIVLSLIYGYVVFSLTAESYIKPVDAGLKIKWFGWLKERNIPDTENEKIILGRLYVHINRKEKKPVKINLEGLEKADKTRLYEFMIEYSKQKNLVLERQLNL